MSAALIAAVAASMAVVVSDDSTNKKNANEKDEKKVIETKKNAIHHTSQPLSEAKAHVLEKAYGSSMDGVKFVRYDDEGKVSENRKISLQM